MASQSDSRVPGRSGEPKVQRPRSGLPPSFGRLVEDEPVEAPPTGSVQAPTPVGVVDGRVVLEVDTQLVIGPEAAQAFYDSVRDLTILAIRDGYAAAMGVKPADDTAAAGGGDKP